MTYWFVRLPRSPESLTFVYDRRLHERTRQDLHRLLDDLDRWSRDYLEGIPFPDRGRPGTVPPSAGPSLEAIDEIDPFARSRPDTPPPSPPASR
jgi:hypothetical protein